MLDLCSLKCRSSRSFSYCLRTQRTQLRLYSVRSYFLRVSAAFFSLKLKTLVKLRQPPIIVAIGVLSVLALIYLQLLPPIFHRFLASSDTLKIVVSIGLIAPLAFFMGMPFPLGIEWLQRHHPHLIAWAWGINGYASVVSAILATCLAISFGFNLVILLAVGIYLIGGCVHLQRERKTAA